MFDSIPRLFCIGGGENHKPKPKPKDTNTSKKPVSVKNEISNLK